MHAALERFSPATREWFAGAFPEPTPAQAGRGRRSRRVDTPSSSRPPARARPSARFSGHSDRLASTPPPEAREHRTRVLYISPLKALGVDVERNLRAPLVGIAATGRRLGQPVPPITVGVRSGDTTAPTAACCSASLPTS